MKQIIEQTLYGKDLVSSYVQVYLHGKSGFDGKQELLKYRDYPYLLESRELIPDHPFVVLHARSGEHWDIKSLSETLAGIKEGFPSKYLHLIGYSRGGEGVYRYISQYASVDLATVINARIFEDLDTTIPLQVIHSRDDHTQDFNVVLSFLDRKRLTGHGIIFDEVAGDHYAIGKIATDCLIEKAISKHKAGL